MSGERGRYGSGPGRSLPILPDDVYLTSYPRSGNTWLRMVLSTLRWGRSTLGTLNARIGDIYLVPEEELARLERPRWLKSHEPLDLVSADFRIALPAPEQALFGAYPTPSRLYEVEPGADADLEQQDGAMRVRLRIAQPIEPGAVDQFGLTITSAAGPLRRTMASVKMITPTFLWRL